MEIRKIINKRIEKRERKIWRKRIDRKSNKDNNIYRRMGRTNSRREGQMNRKEEDGKKDRKVEDGLEAGY